MRPPCGSRGMMTCAVWLSSLSPVPNGLCCVLPTQGRPCAPGGKRSRRRACTRHASEDDVTLSSGSPLVFGSILNWFFVNETTLSGHGAQEGGGPRHMATHREEWVRAGKRRYRPRAASGPRPQTFARTPGPGLPVWKTGMATMVPPSEDGCHKEKLTNAKPLEMSMAQ